jgi:hypothetical protein
MPLLARKRIFRVGGKTYAELADADGNGIGLIEMPVEDVTSSGTLDEMAIRGSTISPCQDHKDFKGVVTFTSTGILVGVGFRIGEHLVVPAHVWDVSDAFASATQTLSDYHDQRWKVLRPNVQSDALFVEVPRRVWSSLGVSSLKVATCSMGRPVVVRWINHTESDSGVQSSGPIRAREFTDRHTFALRHGAATRPGMSGSPVYQGGRVIGMHVAADHDQKHNVFLSLIPNMDVAGIPNPTTTWATRIGITSESWDSVIHGDTDYERRSERTMVDVYADRLADQNFNGTKYVVSAKGKYAPASEFDLDAAQEALDDPESWANLVDEMHRQAYLRHTRNENASTASPSQDPETSPVASTQYPRRDLPKSRRVEASLEQQPTSSPKWSPTMTRALEKASGVLGEPTGPPATSDPPVSTSHSQNGSSSSFQSSETTTGQCVPESSTVSDTPRPAEASPPPQPSSGAKRRRNRKSRPGSSTPASTTETTKASDVRSGVPSLEYALKVAQEALMVCSSAATNSSSSHTQKSSLKQQ